MNPPYIKPNNPFWLSLESKRILVVGAGKTGISAIRYLFAQGASVGVWDSRDTVNMDQRDDLAWLVTGENAELPWQQIDGVVLSPGVSPNHPNLAPAITYQIPMIGDVELFAIITNSLTTRPSVIGITGSNGKTTVTCLTQHIFQRSGKAVLAGGNLGTPVLELLMGDSFANAEFIVLELSSFQLEMCASLHLDVACYLNLSEDHLDRHGSIEHYAAAKQRIYQDAKCAVYWLDQLLTHPQSCEDILKLSFSVSTNSQSDWWYDGKGHRIGLDEKIQINIHNNKLTGLHNVLNLQASAAIAHQCGIQADEITSALASFQPPAHRCIEISQARGIQWIDDSKATNPGATLAALKGVGPITQGKLLLIAGGDAKGADLSSLKAAMHEFVATTITIGKDAALFKGLSPSQVHVESMEMAVKMAMDIAKRGDTVLLSPACASIDMFDNYIHRAKAFADAINRWAA